jgi:hypothetical protein
MLAEAPRSAMWKPSSSTEHYEIELRDVRLNVLWKQDGIKTTTVDFPQPVRERLIRGVEYAWRITAIDRDQSRTTSPFATFTIKP